MKYSGEEKDKESHIERRLEKLKSNLGKKTQNRVKFKDHKIKKTEAEKELKNEIDRLEKELRRKRELLDRELERDAKMLESEKRRDRENFLKEMRGEKNDEESSK